MRKIKRTKHDDYERVIQFPIYSYYRLHIVFTEDIARSRKARYGQMGLSEDATALHTSANGGHAHLFFLIGNCPTGVIAHESWHAVHCMFINWVGAKEMDNEIIAYHIGYITQEIANFRNDLIDAKIGVKSSNKKKVIHGNKISQRVVGGLQSLPAHAGRNRSKKKGKTNTN